MPLACRHGEADAPRLDDGSEPRLRPAALARLDGVVVTTRVRLTTAARGGSLDLRACLLLAGVAPDPDLAVVERTGVSGRSVTLAVERRRGVFACDGTRAPTEHGGRWCGGSFGLVRDGRLLDPRLQLGCRDRRGAQIAFAWVVPLARARWIAVRDGTYTELYEVAAGLPVRVTTHDVRIAGSRALFRIRQYDASGRELSRATLEARVAG